MAHTYTNLLFHIVFSTKDRAPLITRTRRDRLYEYLGGIIRGERGSLIEIGGVGDHVHLLVRFRPEPSMAEMMRRLKANSSTWMNETYRGEPAFHWQTGYAGFSVSESAVNDVRAYIRRQEEHHRTRSFREELIALLRCHRVPYEERYLT